MAISCKMFGHDRVQYTADSLSIPFEDRNLDLYKYQKQATIFKPINT